MSIEVRMPALSPTMETGTLARWLVSVGDVVRIGDPIAEIETDKATMEFEADAAGRVSELIVAEGAMDVPVGAVLATLAATGVDAPSVRLVASPTATSSLAPTPELSEAPSPDAEEIPERFTLEDAATNVVNLRSREIAEATPLARRIAQMQGIALADVQGTGPRGRIVKGDLIAHKPVDTPAAGQASAPPSARTRALPDTPHTVAKLSTMRRTIARRLSESKQTVPHFYLTVRCQIDALLRQREELNADLASRGLKLSVNDMLVKVLALAMTIETDVNVQFAGDAIYRFERVDVSMAVAVPGGLVTPVIRDVACMSLSAIATKTRSLAQRAREGGLMPEELQGGTATISNLGMYGIDEMFPVINPPQALILGVGAGIEQPWKIGDDIALATIMSATASFDHRVIDGAAAAQFMAAFRDLVQRPRQILS